MRTEGGGSYKETARSTRHGCDLQSPLSFHKEGMSLLESEVEWEPACARKWRVNKLYPGEQGAWGLKVGGFPSFREPALCSDLSLAKSLAIIILFPGCGKNAENRLYVFCAINYWSDLLIVYISLRKSCREMCSYQIGHSGYGRELVNATRPCSGIPGPRLPAQSEALHWASCAQEFWHHDAVWATMWPS